MLNNCFGNRTHQTNIHNQKKYVQILVLTNITHMVHFGTPNKWRSRFCRFRFAHFLMILHFGPKYKTRFAGSKVQLWLSKNQLFGSPRIYRLCKSWWCLHMTNRQPLRGSTFFYLISARIRKIGFVFCLSIKYGNILKILY